MIKSIVVAIDSTESSARAQDYALALAKRYHAEVTGIAVLDVPWITAPMATPIGGGYYKEHRDATVMAEHRETLDARINAFRKLCESEGVPMRAVESEGVPAQQIDQESDRHDLIIIGRDTNFHGVKGHDIGDTVEQLLKDNPRPVLVVPPTALGPGNGAVIAFDGSNQASRAMQMFHLMGLANSGPIHIVSVDEDGAAAEAKAACGASFFESHGEKVTPHALQASTEIAATILNTVENLDVGMLVMGAFGSHSLMHQLFVGSVTKQLIRACPIPVFVHH
ncbi:MAG: universal stress protein [Alphaproteobacteria bacterium]|nr:universal stress protein [Alphaproteobacteria bacterium]MCB9929526.1 universal stress protein [Alphaproteobacteria bacterium]